MRLLRPPLTAPDLAADTTSVATASTDGSLLRHNAIYFLGSLVVLGLAASYQFLSGRLLGPRDYASVAAVFSLFSVLLVPGLMVSMVASRSAAAFVATSSADELRLFFRRLSSILVWSSLGAGFLFLLLSPLIARFLLVPPQTVAALTPAVLFILLAAINRGVLQGEQRFLSLSAVQTLDAFSRAVLAVVVIELGFGANGAILAVGAGIVVSYAASFWPLRRVATGHRALRFDAQPVVRFAGPAAVAVAGTTLLASSDVLLVKHYLSAEQAGLYASVATLGRVVLMVTASISAVMFPRVTALEHLGRPSTRTLTLSAVAMVAVASVAVIGLALAPSLALMPFGPQFTTAGPYLPIYGIGMAALALASLLVTYLLARHDHRFVPVIVLVVLLEVVLISAFHASIWQVVWVMVAVGVTMLAAMALLYFTRNRNG